MADRLLAQYSSQPDHGQVGCKFKDDAFSPTSGWSKDFQSTHKSDFNSHEACQLTVFADHLNVSSTLTVPGKMSVRSVHLDLGRASMDQILSR